MVVHVTFEVVVPAKTYDGPPDVPAVNDVWAYPAASVNADGGLTDISTSVLRFAAAFGALCGIEDLRQEHDSDGHGDGGEEVRNSRTTAGAVVGPRVHLIRNE